MLPPPSPYTPSPRDSIPCVCGSVMHIAFFFCVLLFVAKRFEVSYMVGLGVGGQRDNLDKCCLSFYGTESVGLLRLSFHVQNPNSLYSF